jgi:predicted lipoprotein with Yx(FWY)xxD motif
LIERQRDRGVAAAVKQIATTALPDGSREFGRRLEMRRLSLPITIAAFATLAMTGAWADEYGPLKTMKTSAGTVLTDANGMTLYTFDKDKTGQSNCTGECASYWPPAAATKDAKPVGGLTIIKRADGTMQWADDGKPLYTYVSDKKPGDVTGDGKNGVWHVVKEQ